MPLSDPLPDTPSPPLALSARVAALSDTGLRREHNEDRCLVQVLGSPPREGSTAGPLALSPPLLLAVCDGMGGAAAGEVAATVSVETLAERARAAAALPGHPVALHAWLVDGVREANARTLARVREEPELDGMGSTLTAAVLAGGAMVLAQVGDSRGYHLREGRLRRVTEDQSVVGRLVAMGRISEEDARSHERRHLLLEAIGGQADPDVDTNTVPLAAGDRILLCSDGLTDLVRDEEICGVLEGAGEPAEQCAALVAQANRRGGVDNVTVVVAHLS